MMRNHENERTGEGPAADGADGESGAMSGMETGTAPWGVTGEGDARHGDAADAGGERDTADDVDGADDAQR